MRRRNYSHESAEEIEIELGLGGQALAIVDCVVRWDSTPPERDVGWAGGAEFTGVEPTRVRIQYGHDGVLILDSQGPEWAPVAWRAVCRDYPEAELTLERAAEERAFELDEERLNALFREPDDE